MALKVAHGFKGVSSKQASMEGFVEEPRKRPEFRVLCLENSQNRRPLGTLGIYGCLRRIVRAAFMHII